MTLDDDCIKVDVGSTQPWMYETEMWLGAWKPPCTKPRLFSGSGACALAGMMGGSVVKIVSSQLLSHSRHGSAQTLWF
jgi:hypothetical protein